MSTGAPPSLSPPLAPAPVHPSTAGAISPPPAGDNAAAPTTNPGGGGTQSASSSIGGGAQPATSNGAGGGASPSSANGLGGNTAPVPQTLGDALSLCCGDAVGSGSGSDAGNLLWNVVRATANYTAKYRDLVDGDSSGGAFAVTLPAAAAADKAPNFSNSVLVKSEASSDFAITVTPAVGDTIDGQASIVLPPATYLSLVSDGVSNWISIAHNAYPYLDVSTFPGVDLGAKLQAADAFLGATPGTLYIPDGNYLWTTHTTQLHANRVIQFGLGIITCIGQDPSKGPYPGPMAILNDNTVVLGKGDGTVFDEPDSSVLFAPLTSAGFTNVQFRDFKVQNIANGPPLTEGTSLPNIGFDNGNNCSMRNCTFLNTRSLAFTIGGESFVSGHHADGVWVEGCMFDGIKCNCTAAVNGRNFHIDGNTYRNVGTTGPAAPYSAIVCIDLEPNGVTDIMEGFTVSDNIFDMAGNSLGSAIVVQGQGVGKGGVVANNEIFGGTDASNGVSSGIIVNGQNNVLVTGNNLSGQFQQVPMAFNGCTSCVMSDNFVFSSGGFLSGFRSILLIGACLNCRVVGNVVDSPGAEVIGWSSIADQGTCTNTYVYNNELYGDGGNPVPTIDLSGTGSRQWNNTLNGILNNTNAVDTQDSAFVGTATAPGVFGDMPLPSFVFAAPYNGTYDISAIVRGCYSSGGIGSFQITVDGVAVAGSVIKSPFDVSAYAPVSLAARVDLTQGNHTIKVQWELVATVVSFDGVVGGNAWGSRTFRVTSVD